MSKIAKRIEALTKDYEPMPSQTPRDYEKEACWIVAFHIAQDMYESYDLKDWAHFLLGGSQPITDPDKAWEEAFYFPEEKDPEARGWKEPTDDEITCFYGL